MSHPHAGQYSASRTSTVSCPTASVTTHQHWIQSKQYYTNDFVQNKGDQGQGSVASSATSFLATNPVSSGTAAGIVVGSLAAVALVAGLSTFAVVRRREMQQENARAPNEKKNMSIPVLIAVTVGASLIAYYGYRVQRRLNHTQDGEEIKFWEHDEGITIKGSTIICEEVAKQSTKYNAMYLGNGAVEKKKRFVIRVESGEQEGNVWVGWAPKSKFGSGFKIKGFFYGGNLSDGSGLLRAKFGPGLKKNDVIESECSIDAEGRITITFKLNGSSLGTAFFLDGPPPSQLYPVVSFNTGPASATLLPDDFRTSKRDIKSGLGWEGVWSGEEGVVLYLTKTTGDVFNLVVKSSNILQTQVKRESSTRVTPLSPVVSTLMAVSDEVAEREGRLKKLLEKITSIDLLSDEELVLGYDTDKKMAWKRDHSVAEPVNRAEVLRVFS